LGIITSVSTRSGGCARACSSATRRRRGLDHVLGGEQRRDVVAHVGVVVDDEHPRRRPSATVARRSVLAQPAHRLDEEALGLLAAR
jgi:hypothetical protein